LREFEKRGLQPVFSHRSFVSFAQPGFPGYLTFWSKYWPLVFLAVFIALACAFAAVGIAYNNNLSKTFSATDEEHGAAPLALAVLQHLNDWVNEMKVIVLSITTGVRDLASRIVIPPLVRASSNDLVLETQVFHSKYDNSAFSVTANGTVWTCADACHGLVVAADEVGGAITTGVLPTIDDYDSSTAAIRDNYEHRSDDIQANLDDTFNQLSKAQGNVIDDSTRKNVKDRAQQVQDVDTIRNSIFLAIYSLVFLTPLLTAFGLVLKKGCPFKCTFCLGPFYMFIIWILFGLHWIIGMIVGDSCVYFDQKIVKVTEVFDNDGALGGVINACLTNSSLITALELETYTDFSRNVSFPETLSNTTLDEKFNISALFVLSSTVATLDPIAFGFNTYTEIDEKIGQMNNTQTASSGTVQYSWTDVVNCHSDISGCYGDGGGTSIYQGSNYVNILQLQEAVYKAIQVRAVIVDQGVKTIAQDTQSITNHTAMLKELVRGVGSDLNKLELDLAPIFHDVDRFRDRAYCYFIAQDFGKFKNTYCNNFQESIAWMTFSMFMIGLSCFGITWCSRWSSYRIQFVPKIVPAPFDENAWMQQNGYAPQPAGGAAGYGGGQYTGGVQLAQVADEPQQQFHEQPQQNTYVATDAGEAINAPSYDAALASYKQPDFQDPEKPPSNWHEDAEAPAAVSTEQPVMAGEIAHSDDAAQGLPGQTSPTRPICESCESEQVSIHCAECEENLCTSCDATLHKSAANAGHNRSHL
jgi:hypothetical protein